MNVPMRLTGTARVGIKVARKPPEEKIDDDHHQDERFNERFLDFVIVSVTKVVGS